MYEYDHTFEYQQTTTFGLLGRILDDDGTPIDLTPFTLTAKIKDANDKLIADAVITRVNPAEGVFHVTLPDGISLPLKHLYMDIRVVGMESERVTKKTIRLAVKKVVTDA